VAPAVPAHADRATVRDRSGDIAQPWDLHRVTVDNRARNVWVKIALRDLAPDIDAGASVFLDTDGDPRPEFVMAAGLFDGTDYNLAATGSWSLRKQGRMVDCSYRMWLDYEADTARIRISKACLASVPGDGTVRVEVRTSGTDEDGRTVTDWLRKPRRFGATRVAQG
jgi:hypothetical protein